MVLSVQDHSLHPPKTWVKLWVKPMRQSSKSPVYQGFSALQVEEIRPQSRSSRSPVQQALNFFKSGQKPRKTLVFWGFLLFYHRKIPISNSNQRCILRHGFTDRCNRQLCVLTRMSRDNNPNPLRSFAIFLRNIQPAFWLAAPLRRTSVLPQAKPWRRANSLRPSISITEGGATNGSETQIYLWW